MGNLENLKENNNNNDQDYFYKEIASFSGSSAAEDVRFNNFYPVSCINNEPCDTRKDLYNMRIKLFGNTSSMGKIFNELLIDSTCDNYSYVNNTAHLDGKRFNPDFDLDDILTGIYSNNGCRLVELSLTRNFNGNNLNSYESKFNSVGFKLSEIISSIGDFNRLKEYSKGLFAEISVEQSAYLVNKCCGKYVIFNFKLSNTGNGVGQNILFKNIFSNNIFLSERCVFLDGNRVNCKYIDLINNRLLVRLPNINKGESLNLTVVGFVRYCGLNTNFASISYVSRVFRNFNGVNVDLSQKLSNVKVL